MINKCKFCNSGIGMFEDAVRNKGNLYHRKSCWGKELLIRNMAKEEIGDVEYL